MASEHKVLDKRKEKQLLQVLAELGGGRFDPEDDIIHEGNRIILPEHMTIKQAIQGLTQRQDADAQQTAFSHTFNYRPWDGAVCTWRALKRAFGMVGLSGGKGMSGAEPGEMRSIPIGYGVVETVPWGEFTLPMFNNTVITPGGKNDPELGSLFTLTINGPRKYRAQAMGIFKLVQQELETNSIYRGKAFDGQEMPEFLDLSAVDPDRIIYSEDTETQLEANIWSVLRYRDELEKAGITRKRAILLHGDYGTGKTLTGSRTAIEAVASAWTFILVRPGKDNLADVMQTARLYQPCCVFVEDLDTVADPEATNADAATKLLDLFDGMGSKGTELMVVLTTNHPKKIHKGMLRPGRLDSVIRIKKLDELGVTRLIQTSLPPENLAADIDWHLVYESMKEYIPAYVKEAADRAFRYALTRRGKVEGIVLTTDDLVNAGKGLQPQLELMNQAQEHKRIDEAGDVLRRMVRDGLAEHIVGDIDPEYQPQLTPEARKRAEKSLNGK